MIACVSVMAGLLASRISSRIEASGAQDNKQLIGTSVSALIYPHINGVVNHFASSILPISDDALYKCQAVFETIIRTSKPTMLLLPKEIQASISRIDIEIQNSIRALKQNQTPDFGPATIQAIYEVILIRQAFWLGQPRRCENYLNSLDSTLLAALVDRQPEGASDTFNEVANSIIASSIRGESDNSRPQFIIYGPAGTGKTTAVEALAKALGAPLIKLNYEKMEATDISGENYSWSISKIPGEKENVKIKGAIRDAVRGSGIRNPIVLIDEFSAQEMKRSYWKEGMYKKLFNPDAVDDDNDKNGQENLAHVIFFILTNDKREDFSPAMRSRFIEIDMPALDDETFRKIRDTRLSTSAEQFRSLLREDRWQQDNQAITTELFSHAVDNAVDVASNHLEFISQKNKDKGARTIQAVVSQVIDHLLVEKLRAADPDYEVPDEKIKQMIEKRSVFLSAEATQTPVPEHQDKSESGGED